MPQTLRKHLSLKPLTSQFAILGTAVALAFSASSALAAAPDIVVDSQIQLLSGLNGPQSVAVAPNNTCYVADAGNNRVLASINGTFSAISTGTLTLVNPKALAVDSLGDLFIGDQPASTTGRVLEALATNGVLNGTVQQVWEGGLLEDVTALAVDNTSTSSTFNTLYIGDDISNAVYSLAPGGTTLVSYSGLPSDVVPTALVKDASGNLFVGDFLSYVYEASPGSTTFFLYFVPNFTLFSPTGLALDPKGDLYILTLTNIGSTPSQPVPENIVEIPGEDTSSAFRVPFTGITNSSGIALNSLGNLYIVDLTGNELTELIYGSPAGLSSSPVGTVGPSITFNYELNAETTVRGFQFVSSGDVSTEIQNEGGDCANGKYTDGSDGGPISPSDPFVCQQNFAAEPSYPGLRYGAIRLRGLNATTTVAATLETTDVYSTGIAGASVVYPLTAAAGATDISGPFGVAISGLDKKIYITNSAPAGEAAIYSASGPNGKTLTPVSTAPVSLSQPLGIAINGAGDLYVVDFSLAQVVVVPANTAITPYAFNPGNLLQHPISIGFDTSGNLFIGDAGPNGVDADATTPGYLVEMPVGGGAPFEINTGAVTVIYPQGVALDPYTGDIYVADGGDPSGNGAKVVHVVANGGPASVVDFGDYPIVDPVAIVFDPAESFYVLDQGTLLLTEYTSSGYFYTVPINDSSLFSIPNALAVSPGSQNFTAVNLANVTTGTDGNLVYVNSTKSTLDFGTVTVGQSSATMHARINNIGSAFFTFSDPYVTSTGSTSSFVDTYNTCFSLLQLSPASPCDQYWEFEPGSSGHVTATYTFQTNAYLPSDSVLELEGTGRNP